MCSVLEALLLLGTEGKVTTVGTDYEIFYISFYIARKYVYNDSSTIFLS